MTEYIIVMSLGPTYRPTSPEATDEIRTFGVPIGNARMAGATIEAPPEPPALMIPTTSPCRRTQASKASAIAATDAPRSRPKTLDPPRPWFSATSCAVTSQVASLPLVETSTSRVLRPLAGDEVANEAEFRTLGVERADDEDYRWARLRRRRRRATLGGLLETGRADRGGSGARFDPGVRNGLRPTGRRNSDWRRRS